MSLTDTYYIEDEEITVDGKNYSVHGTIDIYWDVENDSISYEDCTRNIQEAKIDECYIYEISLIDDDGNEYSYENAEGLIANVEEMLYNRFDKVRLKDIVEEYFMEDAQSRYDEEDYDYDGE